MGKPSPGFHPESESYQQEFRQDQSNLQVGQHEFESGKNAGIDQLLFASRLKKKSVGDTCILVMSLMKMNLSY